MDTIKQTIKCPECGCVQDAEIKLAIPFDIYIHDCESCGYVIMESEWLTPNLDKSTENLSKIKDKDEWLREIRGG